MKFLILGIAIQELLRRCRKRQMHYPDNLYAQTSNWLLTWLLVVIGISILYGLLSVELSFLSPD